MEIADLYSIASALLEKDMDTHTVLSPRDKNLANLSFLAAVFFIRQCGGGSGGRWSCYFHPSPSPFFFVVAVSFSPSSRFHFFAICLLFLSARVREKTSVEKRGKRLLWLGRRRKNRGSFSYVCLQVSARGIDKLIFRILFAVSTFWKIPKVEHK